MICPHCKQRDSPEIDHDHFLTYEFSSPSQTKKINEFSVLLVSMKTPQKLVSLLKNGLLVFYNNSNNQKNIFSTFRTFNVAINDRMKPMSYNKSIIININNKKNKENVIKKSLKKIDQNNPFLDNITD